MSLVLPREKEVEKIFSRILSSRESCERLLETFYGHMSEENRYIDNDPQHFAEVLLNAYKNGDVSALLLEICNRSMFDLLKECYLIPKRFHGKAGNNPVLLTDADGELAEGRTELVPKHEYKKFQEIYQAHSAAPRSKLYLADGYDLVRYYTHDMNICEKKEKKEKKNAKGNASEPEEDEDEKGGGRLILVLTTILIIALWMGIIGILIKTDVGGFGSTVLYPLLKDVPYVNKILPQPEETVEQTEGTEHQYGSLSEAISQIKELEKELDEASSTNKNDKKKIKDLKAQIKDLSKYKEDEAAFEKEKEKYYEEVVFSDQAPDIQQYKTYYESIDPENAEVLYKQVVEQITYDSQVEDYAKTYSNMKPQEAASIFDTMTDNLGLVADILMNMGTQQRADILGKMDATTAAKLTEIMEPTKKK